jgi:hypothetical protein
MLVSFRVGSQRELYAGCALDLGSEQRCKGGEPMPRDHLLSRVPFAAIITQEAAECKIALRQYCDLIDVNAEIR